MLSKRIRPRFCEVNSAGHVGHQVIPVWLEEGFLDIFWMFGMETDGKPPLIMANMNIDFQNEIFLGKDVEVLTDVKSIGNSSFVLEQKILQEGRPCAKAQVKFVHFNYAVRKPERIPSDIRLRLEQHLTVS